MRKQFTKSKKPLYMPDKDNRASKIASSKAKNKYLANNLSTYDWETETEFNRSNPEPINRFDIS